MATKEANNTKEKPNKHPAGPGRPTKLTPEVIENFTTAISIGSSVSLAARYAKISEEVAWHWLRLGRRERERIDNGEKADPAQAEYLSFLREVEQAEADAGISWQQIVNKAANVDPDWAFKMLRTRFPNGYSTNDLVTEIEIPPEMPTVYLDRIIAGEDPLVVISDYKSSQGQSSSPGVEAEKAKRKSRARGR